MSCPVCSHSMATIGMGMAHCWRCGCLTGCHADGSPVVPALVSRCRAFARVITDDERGRNAAAWRRLGIEEAITPAHERGGAS